MTNPFDADEDHTNPFGNTAKDPEKDSYQPPKETVDPASYSPYQAPSSKPAYNEPAYNQSPSYSQNTYKNNHSSNTKKDDEFLDPVTKMKISNKDLDKKEAVLRNREQKLQSIEQQIANGTFQKPKNDKNFPPFVRWWSWHPERDLPENSVKLVKIIRWIYLGSVLVYLVNWIGCLACLAKSAAQATSSPAMKIILSSIFLIVFCPISFEISFFVLYKSLKNGKALRFFCFMLTYFIWFGILAFNLIGINNGGSVGFIQMINLFTGSTGVAVIALIFCILGCCDAAAMVWTFIQLIRYYKTNGIDKKAFKEGSTFAANYAKDHKEEIASYAADNREDIARIAADGYGDEI